MFVVGILLTKGSILTIVQRKTMQSMVPYGKCSRVSKRHSWICLLLPLLFLHNPFLVAPNSSSTLELQHPPSYRATIASSELLKFKNPEGLESIVLRSLTFVDWEFLKAAILAQPHTSFAQPGDLEDLLHPQQLPSSSLWFRPPPVA